MKKTKRTGYDKPKEEKAKGTHDNNLPSVEALSQGRRYRFIFCSERQEKTDVQYLKA